MPQQQSQLRSVLPLKGGDTLSKSADFLGASKLCPQPLSLFVAFADLMLYKCNGTER